MKKFLLEIITPEKITFSQEVEMVRVPGSLGQLGILSNHTPLFAKLIEGELKIIKQGKDSFLSIGGGFLEVVPEKTMVLVGKAVHAEELNEKAILRAKRQAEEALKKKPEGEELRAAKALLRSSLIDFKILKKRKHKSAYPKTK